MYNQKFLYIFFIILALNLSFFSTSKIKAQNFFVDQIEISEKLERNFNKETLINRGFKKAFIDLMEQLVQSKDFDAIKNTRLSEIKSMIETFTIQEEKFVNKSYNLNLGVSFNKKKIYDYLTRKKIFPSQIVKEKFLFLPILLDQLNNDVLVYSENPFYDNWKSEKSKDYLIDYILPTEDLEDLSLIRKNYLEIENYNFEKIIEKYSLNHSIVTVFFINENEIKVLSKIKIKDKKFIKSNSFKSINLNNPDNLNKLINELKTIYEDFWKENNLINTSIKLSILIEIDNKDFDKSKRFEKTISKIDIINNFSIIKFNKDSIIYELIFNGTSKDFINIMKEQNFNFDTQNKVWILND